MTKESKEGHFSGQVTQKACIQRNGQVLLVKCADNGTRAAGMLDIPGGRLHEGEDVIDGLKREVLEEIGAEINVHKIIATGTIINMSNLPNYFVIYQASLVNPNAVFTPEIEEIEEIAWYESKEVSTLPMVYREYQEALVRFFKESRKV